MKRERVYSYIIGSIIYLRLIFQTKEVPKENFNIFIRENFHKIFDIDRQLIITQIMLLCCVYVSFYSISVRNISLEIMSFKKMIRYKSKTRRDMQKKELYFFGKYLLIDSMIMILVFVSVYMILKGDYNFFDYVYGIMDLIKLSIILFLVLLLGISYDLNKLILFILNYFCILIYIFFLNYMSFEYFLVLIVFGLMFIFGGKRYVRDKKGD